MLSFLCQCFETRRALIGIALVSVITLAVAWVMEHYFSIQACQLCYFERYIYGIAALVAFLGIFLKRPGFLLATGFIFLFGVILSFYHVGIQQGWFELPALCQSKTFDPAASLEELRAQLLGTPVISCNMVSWSLFGISLAGYNMIFSVFLSLMSFLAFWRNHKCVTR